MRRNLLEVDAVFTGTDDPGTYRLQPALRAELLRLAGDDGRAQGGYAAYGAWLARCAYGEIDKDPGLAKLVQQSFGALDAATASLEGEARLWHIRRVAWLRVQYGELGAVLEALHAALDEASPGSGVRSSLAFELAGALVTRGDLDRAMELYEESLALKEVLGDVWGKSATLHQMAGVLVTRGDLDGAMALYEQSLATVEALGDVRGKSATLHQMATVLVTRGDLDGAMALYEQSLATVEALGDVRGKSATLQAMATVLVTRGELDRAMALYEQSLATYVALVDVRGKASTLHQMATVLVTRGELDRAMELYEESLALKEALGDVQGKSATLSMIANIHMARGAWEQAESVLAQALGIARQLGEILRVAFTSGKLGQVAQVRGDVVTALLRFREALELFERLGMPREAQQVREFIARAEAAQRGDDPTANLRRQLGEAMPAALADDDQERRESLIENLETIASQTVDGESPGSPWLALAALLRGAVALLRGEDYERTGLLPGDAALLEAWARGEIGGQETDEEEHVSLADAISVWAEGAEEDDEARAEALVTLLNHCADATIVVLREGDAETMEALAETLIPLRVALRRWPRAAELPPFNAFLGCLQALLRGDEAQFTRLAPVLDEGLAGALAQVVALAQNGEVGKDDGPEVTEGHVVAARHAPSTPEGASSTTEGVPSTTEGVSSATEGVSSATEGVSSATEGVSSATEGVHAVTEGVHAVTEGVSSTTEGVSSTTEGVSSATEGVSSTTEVSSGAETGAPFLPSALSAALDHGDLQAVERELAALAPAERERALHALRRRSEEQVARMSPEQQRAFAARLQSEQHAQATRAQADEIARTADEIAGVAAQTLREGDGNTVRALAIQVAQAASHYAQGEERGSPYDELASFLRGVAALLRGTPVPPVPPSYAAHIAELRRAADEARNSEE